MIVRFVSLAELRMYMLLQRGHSSSAIRWIESSARKLSFSNVHVFKGMLILFCMLFGNKIESIYRDSCREAVMRKLGLAFPGLKAETILEIGGGVGGNLVNAIDFLGARKAFLVDLDLFKPAWGYNSGGAYNDLEVSLDYISGVPNCESFAINGNSPSQLVGVSSFDLVYSFIAWGFHFPISTYLQFVSGKLNPDGVGLVEIRKTHIESELEVLSAAFDCVEVVYEEPKLVGVKFRRRAS